jgi:gliding motility-associated-like protein
VPALEQTATSGWFFYPSLKFLNNDYLVDTYNLSNYFAQEKSTIVVVTHTAGANQTILNNINIGSMLQPVAGNPQYSTARIDINTGFNEISNPNGLIVWSTSYQTASDSIATSGNYICSGAPLVMSFYKPTYEGKINAIPIENTLIDPYTICVGTPLQYTVVTNADSNLTNVWEFGDGGLTAGDTVFHTYADTGYYHVNLFVNSYCDTIKGLVHVVAPPVIAMGNDTTICSESSLILDASVSGNATYLWSTSSTSPQITVGDTGTYCVTATTDAGCVVSDTIHVSMYPTVNVNLGNDTGLCYLADILLDATQPLTAHAGYLWQDQSTNSTYTVIYQGQYWVVVTNLCTQKSDTINIESLMNPTLYLGNDTTICMNHKLFLDASIPWGISYQWENGSTSVTRWIENEGEYWVQASNPCVSVSDTIFIKVDDCDPILVIPNVFTPNDDGFNDLFIVDVIKNITSINILIFNRWGENIFQSNNLNFAWDGQLKNQKCPEGVYFWVVQYVDINGDKHDLSGTVTLLR